jgi:Flp pilus assembly protein TadG
MRLIGHPERGRRARGQALVEFSLVIPIFLTLILAIAEFSFLLVVKVGTTDAAQDAVQYASELGQTANADFYILQLVEKDMAAPIDRTRIQSVSIFWTDPTGANKGADTYTRSGTWTLNSVTIPYSVSGTKGYPEASRCNTVSASVCGGVQWIGVTVTYKYAWITPLPNLVGLGSSPPTFVQTSTSRLEPIQ